MKETSLGPQIPAMLFNSSIKPILILFWPCVYCLWGTGVWDGEWCRIHTTYTQDCLGSVTSSVASEEGVGEAAPGWTSGIRGCLPLASALTALVDGWGNLGHNIRKEQRIAWNHTSFFFTCSWCWPQISLWKENQSRFPGCKGKPLVGHRICFVWIPSTETCLANYCSSSS